MSLTRKFQGVWIPAETWLDHSLSITEKVMLVEIGSLQDDVRGCYASNAHFAEFFGLSISRVSEIISGLATKGMVEVEQVRDGKRVVERRIRVVPVEVDRRKPAEDPFGKPKTTSEKTANPFGKDGEPPSENTKGSNTRFNNTQSNTPPAAREDGPDLFEEFWKEYPRKVGKDAARKAFVKRKPTRELLASMLVALAGQRVSFDWTKDDGRYIPHPATWLNQGRWQDEVRAGGRPAEAQQTRHHGLGQRQYGDDTGQTVLTGGL